MDIKIQYETTEKYYSVDVVLLVDNQAKEPVGVQKNRPNMILNSIQTNELNEGLNVFFPSTDLKIRPFVGVYIRIDELNYTPILC